MQYSIGIYTLNLLASILPTVHRQKYFIEKLSSVICGHLVIKLLIDLQTEKTHQKRNYPLN